jgi:hypothetical protein
MHVLLIDVEERNSERKMPSILGKEREKRGRKEGILNELNLNFIFIDGQRIVLVHQSEETYVWGEEVVIKVNRSHCSTRMDETNVVWTIRMLA